MSEEQPVGEAELRRAVAESRRRREEACTAEVQAALQEILARHNCDLEIVIVESSINGRTYQLNFVARS